MSEDMHPKHITHRSQLRDKQPYLHGHVTSGDHPVQWQVYEKWQDWVYDLDIEDDDLNEIQFLNLYELSWALSYRHRPEGL